MSTLKKPNLADPKLRAKLAKGMGHNYYGEPAWPNDLLYIFPVVILGTVACVVGLAVLDPAILGEPANPFATPLEILPEWYLYPVFQILRVVPNKLLGIVLQTLIIPMEQCMVHQLKKHYRIILIMIMVFLELIEIRIRVRIGLS